MAQLHITKSYLPPRRKLNRYIDRIYRTHHLTNGGPLVQKLEQILRAYLGVNEIVLVSSGTAALQLSYRLFKLQHDVITTPFTFIATSSSLKWEGLNPIFSDIDTRTFNLSPQQISEKINPKVSAIVATHVFGNPCDLESLESVAKHHHLKLIFDAAHAFDIRYNETSCLNYGDASILSFHATKLFHTIEGGALILNDSILAEEARSLRNFGYRGLNIESVGINMKMNEFSAAMGLCILEEIKPIISKRREAWEYYADVLGESQFWNVKATRNYQYFPYLCQNSFEVLHLIKEFTRHDIYPRRYFCPSLDTLPIFQPNNVCVGSRNIADRIICLPLSSYITRSELKKVVRIMREV